MEKRKVPVQDLTASLRSNNQEELIRYAHDYPEGTAAKLAALRLEQGERLLKRFYDLLEERQITLSGAARAELSWMIHDWITGEKIGEFSLLETNLLYNFYRSTK